MKFFDFTLLGGFPFTQDSLKHMQEGYSESISGMLGVTVDPNIILSGCEVTGTTASFTIAPGVIAINGQVMSFVGGTTNDVSTAKIKIVTLTSTLVYDNGSSFDVKKTSQAILDASGTIFFTDVVPFLVSATSKYVSEEQDATPEVSGAVVKYKVDTLNKLVHVWGYCPYQNDFYTSKVIASGLPEPLGAWAACSVNIKVEGSVDEPAQDVNENRFWNTAGHVYSNTLRVNTVPLLATLTNGTTFSLSDWSFFFNFSYQIQ